MLLGRGLVSRAKIILSRELASSNHMILPKYLADLADLTSQDVMTNNFDPEPN